MSDDYVAFNDASNNIVVERLSDASVVLSDISTTGFLEGGGSITTLSGAYATFAGNVFAWVTPSHEADAVALPAVADVPHAIGATQLGTTVSLASAATKPWSVKFEFSEPLTSCSVTVRNLAHAIVATLPCTAASEGIGEAGATWNARATGGSAVPAGAYTASLAAANATGAYVSATGAPVSLVWPITVVP
jgi:hypothetical protein